jgi:hypothetical protein
MLKSAILLAISIATASSWSIPPIANARLIGKASAHQSHYQSKSSLVARQSKITPKSISESDLQGINQTITEHYLNKNQILENAASNARRFYEVKSLKLLSFSSTKAQVEVEEHIRSYVLANTHLDPQQRSFQKVSGSEYTKHVFNIDLEKLAGKWRINK